MKTTKITCFASLFLLIGCLSSCQNNEPKVSFTWENTGFEEILGNKVNNETFNYDLLTVNPVSGLRSDFLMGVDASMVLTVEEKGGVYYNRHGVEQDVFQIMANEGVNAFRTRIWNNPYNIRGDGYGGGDVDTDRAILMAKRAQAANMKIMVDLHYSDFWADPDSQEVPRRWATINSIDELAKEIKDFTTDVLFKFKNAGVNVDIIQIGNEINNGMIFPLGRINWNDPSTSFSGLSKLLNAGISGAKSVNKKIYSLIHLANGGNSEEFDFFFSQLNKYNVNYDIIGASYYPYFHGTLEQLQKNLNNVAKKFNKPVVVAETSYGFTLETTAYAANQYSLSYEDNGGYLTSLQGQTTAIRDVINVVAGVPNDRGLGIFYWEPAWLPVAGAGWANMASGRVDGADGLSSWSNQALFSYSGKVLPSMQVFKMVKGNQEKVTEVAVRPRTNSLAVTLNKAENEKLPSTYPMETNLSAIRRMSVEWDAGDLAKLENVGQYQVKGRVIDRFEVTANVTVIENFIRDPGYENQGITDEVVAPWVIASQTPQGEKVVKLDRKNDTRTGTTDLNWYHDNKDISFTVKQDITGLDAGLYALSVYCMAISPTDKIHHKLEIYIKYNNGQKLSYDLTDKIIGWGSKDVYYVKAEILNISITNPKVEVGIEVNAVAKAWGHIDDWALVRV